MMNSALIFKRFCNFLSFPIYCIVASASPKTTRVGWVGTGVMGKAMCQHIIDAGYKCTVVRVYEI